MTLNKYGASKHGRSCRRDQDSTISSISDSSKSSQAAQMAQSLGSQTSWADTFAPQTPASTMTPAASNVDGEEQHRHMLHAIQDHPDDPPPAYEDSGVNRPPVPELSSAQQPVTNHPFGSNNVRPSYGLESHQGASVSTSTSNSRGGRRDHNDDDDDDVEEGDEEEVVQAVNDPQATDDTALLRRTGGRAGRKCRRAREREKRQRWTAAVCFLAFLLPCIWLMSRQGMIAYNVIKPSIPLPARNYTRHETSSTISGTFTFYDYLDLSTSSGSISIILDPQPGDGPAVLKLSTRSGSIKVNLADTFLQHLSKEGTYQRPWNVIVETQSGSSRVTLPIGNGGSTTIKAVSGSMGARLLAGNLGPNDPISHLLTEGTSGSQNISIEPINRPSSSVPINKGDDKSSDNNVLNNAITNLVARHYSKGSASLKVFYPQSWQGVLHASVGGYSSVKVTGEALQYQHNGDRDVYAWRGEGSSLDVRVDGSASIKVDCSASSR